MSSLCFNVSPNIIYCRYKGVLVEFLHYLIMLLRKYSFGYENRKKKQKVEKLIQSQARALEDNFFGGKKQIEISSSSVDEDLVIEEPSCYTNTVSNLLISDLYCNLILDSEEHVYKLLELDSRSAR